MDGWEALVSSNKAGYTTDKYSFNDDITRLKLAISITNALTTDLRADTPTNRDAEPHL